MTRVKADLAQRPAILMAMVLMLSLAPMFGVSASKNAASSAITGRSLPTAMQAACTGVRFTQAAGSPVSAGDRPQEIAAGDFNLDGKADLAVTNGADDNVTIQLGNGSGGFTQAAGSPINVGDFPESITIGDFNLDGKPDLATANPNSNNVTILLGDGNGGFTQAAGSPVAVGANPNSVAVGDFNLDGKADLATVNITADNVTVLLGNGSGGFTEAAGSPVGVGDTPIFVAAGDFNLDGKGDLATANLNADNVTILLGNGSGGFTQAAGSPVGAGSSPNSIAIGDFNLDGKADLAVANAGSDNVTILLGDGNGGFTQPAGSPVGVGDAPVSVAIGDFNLDGKADLAAVNTSANNVTILLGNGSGNFAQPAGSPVGVGPQAQFVATGDFNLDGKADLAVANAGTDNVTIQLNTCGSNEPPAIIATPVTRNAGSPSANSQIATVNDAEDAENILTVTVNGGASAIVNSVTVSGISVSAAGVVTANVVAACGAAAANFTLRVTDSNSLFAEAALTVSVNPDNQPPVITCPASIVGATPSPNASCLVVNYPAPVASDNCPGVTAVCNPPSGTCFPLGTTTVTCTATDSAGNTAQCGFTVTTFDFCLQDDSNPATALSFNSQTGDYRFCTGGVSLTGKGTVSKQGLTVTLTHNPSDRRVQARVDGAANRATASLQSPPGVVKCTITDRNLNNNTCACQ